MNKFSIILPVRNGGEYVKTCVNSILSQTNTDFNLLVLDNNSTDGTREWITSLQNEKIIIHSSEKSLTIEENWARATTVPKNEFITLIGHDDILYPDFLETIDKLISHYPDAGLYHTHFNFIDAAGNNIRRCKTMPTFLPPEDLLKGFLTQSIDSMGTGYVMRAKNYDDADGIPVRYPSLLFADFELWIRMAMNGGVAVDQETCFAFRVHKGTTGAAADLKIQRGLNIYVDFLNAISQNERYCQVIHSYAKNMLLFYCKGFSHRMLRTPKSKRQNLTVKKFIEQTKEMAVKLGVDNSYKPEKEGSIRIALFVDRFYLTRNLFLFFKKLFPKPILK